MNKWGGGTRKQVQFNTELKLTQRDTVEFLLEKVVGDQAKGKKRAKQVLIPPALCARAQPVERAKVLPSAKPPRQVSSRKGKVLTLMDVQELKAKGIKLRDLPDDQRIRVQGKTMTIGELRVVASRKGQPLEAVVGVPLPVAADPDIKKIERALANASHYRREGLAKIAEVESRVEELESLLTDCPAPAPQDRSYSSGPSGSFWSASVPDVDAARPSWPLWGVVRAIDGFYRHGAPGRCDHYSQNAQTARDNSERHLDYLNEIIAQLNYMENVISSYRSSYGVSDSDKSWLQGTLSRFNDDAQGEADEFDRYIDDIEEFLRDYKQCKEG